MSYIGEREQLRRAVTVPGVGDQLLRHVGAALRGSDQEVPEEPGPVHDRESQAGDRAHRVPAAIWSVA